MRSVVFLSILASIVFTIPNAHAICLDPKTFISGYKIPFDEELDSSTAVIIGAITEQKNVNEDSSDPEGVAAFLYTVDVLRQLKGNLPKTIRVRAEADSGRYAMGIGEQHVLFLLEEGSHFVASGCGNSSQLPEGNDVVAQVEIALTGRENVP